MTAEGRKVPHPSPEQPAYYYPVVAGYRQIGNMIAGETSPPILKVIHHLALALAKQGYVASHEASSDHARSKRVRSVLALTPPPSLILVFHWGSMNPVVVVGGDPAAPNPVVVNQSQMVALVGGQSLDNLDLAFEREAVMQGAERDRYFVTVAAYDFAAYSQRHRKVVLWMAKMSLPSDGVTMPQVMPSLIAAGEPFLGRETTRPQWVTVPAVPDGRVEFGDLKVIEYLDAPASANPKAAP